MIELKDIARRYRTGGQTVNALDGVDLTIERGEFVGVTGPSGSGKSTLLNVLGCLDRPDAGHYLLEGTDVAGLDDGQLSDLRNRRIGFVFQSFHLVPRLTAAENVALPMMLAGIPAAERAKRVAQALKDFGLDQRADHRPDQLSGGQRQRVALARALAIEPRVLLLDEPFGALDARVRKDLRQWLRELHCKTGYTTIFVTHDQEEALELADRVVVMNRGAIEQVGSVDQVYERPASPFVFDFLGGTNVIAATVQGRAVRIREADIAALRDSLYPNGPADVYVRPGDLRVSDADAPGLEVTVAAVQRTGPIVRAVVEHRASGQRLQVELPHLHHDVPAFVPGAELRLRLAQFSVYPRAERPEPVAGVAAPVLIGRERARTEVN
jgi:sulfate transport system ATP-binding protein